MTPKPLPSATPNLLQVGAVDLQQTKDEAFAKFICLLYWKFLKPNKQIRLSELGNVMRGAFVYSGKYKLQVLVQQAVNLGLAKRSIQQGPPGITLCHSQFLNYFNDLPPQPQQWLELYIPEAVVNASTDVDDLSKRIQNLKL